MKQGTTKTKLKTLKEILIPIDKLSNLIFDAQVSEINRITEDQRLNIKTKVTIKYPKDEHGNDITLTPFDKLIFTLALSEKAAGNNFFSYTRIFHSSGGGTNLKNNAYNVSKAIEYTFWKLRLTNLTVDITDIVKVRKKYTAKLHIQPDYKGRIIWSGVLLPNEVITATVNGKTAEGVVHFLGDTLDDSILFTIADLKNQIARCNVNLLAAPVKNTEKTLTLKFYLLERILKIKGSNEEKRTHVTRLNNTILFDTLFKQCGLTDSNKNRKSEFRKTVVQILNFFKEQNFISGYEFEKEEEKITAINIKY